MVVWAQSCSQAKREMQKRQEGDTLLESRTNGCRGQTCIASNGISPGQEHCAVAPSQQCIAVDPDLHLPSASRLYWRKKAHALHLGSPQQLLQPNAPHTDSVACGCKLTATSCLRVQTHSNKETHSLHLPIYDTPATTRNKSKVENHELPPSGTCTGPDCALQHPQAATAVRLRRNPGAACRATSVAAAAAAHGSQGTPAAGHTRCLVANKQAHWLCIDGFIPAASTESSAKRGEAGRQTRSFWSSSMALWTEHSAADKAHVTMQRATPKQDNPPAK
jgi:hypothetical protein